MKIYIIIEYLISFIEYLISLLLNRVYIKHIISDNNNFSDIKTHTINKKYIKDYYTEYNELYCVICNKKLYKMVYCKKVDSLTCKEQQIKNLLE